MKKWLTNFMDYMPDFIRIQDVFKFIKTGTFQCPICNNKKRPYNEMKTREYITVFRIPLIPHGPKIRYIECLKCYSAFNPETFQYSKELTKKANNVLGKWARWSPIEGLDQEYDIESISDSSEEGFKILLSSDENKMLQIIFENSVHSYQYTSETLRMVQTAELGNEYDSFFYGWTFFRVTNSRYLRWLSKQREETNKTKPLMHFCIITMNDVVDIAATYNPKVKFITLNKQGDKK